MLQVLKPEYKQRIKEDQELQLKIAKALQKKNIVTVQRWVKKDDVMLTLPIVQDIIREYCGLSKKVELLEKIESSLTPAA